MKYNEATHTTTLSSGRSFYTFCGRPHPEPGGGLTYGHDGIVDELLPPLTLEERREIAEAMKALWDRWSE